MNRALFLVLGAFLALGQFACGTKKFFATPPDYNPEIQAYVPQPSLIQLPITISMESISKALNEQLEGVIYDDQDYLNNDGDNLKVRVSRTKKMIKADGYKEKLRIILPLEIWASYRYDACDICPVVEKSTEFEMDITLNSLIRIGSNWEALLTTTATDIKFSKEPQLEFGPVKIPITRLVRNALTSNIQAITAQIDKEVSDNVPLRKSMEAAWEGIQEPILVDSAFKTWLVLVPQKVFVTPLINDAQKLTLSAGISTMIETRLGAKPKRGKSTLLGAPVILEKIDQKFAVEVPVSVDFDMATELARKNMKDSTYELGKGKKITIKDILVYGKGGDVFIKTDLEGSFDGVIYFRGKPAIDTLTNKIYFADLDFDVNTKNAIYKMAAWMAHGTLKKILAKEFVYDLSADLSNAQKTIQEYLNGYVYEDLLTVKGKMGKLKLVKIYCNEEVIQAIFSANGSASVHIDNLTISSPKK